MKANPELKFYHGLARELGMTVGRLMDEVDSQELAQWMAFFSLEEEERKQKQQTPKQEDPKALAEKIKASLGGYKGGRKKSR